MTGSLRSMLGELMSILARSAIEPSACLPACISLNRTRFCSGEVSLKGLFVPSLVGVPF